MNFSIILIMTFIIERVLTANDNKNNLICDEENKSKADLCAEKLWFVGRKSRKYPENENQMNKHCKQTQNLVKCVKDFTDQCGKGVQKQLANVMLFTFKSVDKNYCTKNQKREQMIKMSLCANTIRKESTKCMDKFLIDLGKANQSDNKHKVPQACCAFYNLKSCILRKARSVGDPICCDKSLDNFENYINSMSGNTLNLMCADYEEDSDKCQTLPNLPKGDKSSKVPTIIEGFGNLLDE